MLSISETAKMLGVNPATLRRWEKDGEFVPDRTPGGHRRYRRAAVQIRQMGITNLASLHAKAFREAEMRQFVPTYIGGFDRHLSTGGVRNGSLWMIGADTRDLATELAMYTAVEASCDGLRTLYVSLSADTRPADLLMTAAQSRYRQPQAQTADALIKRGIPNFNSCFIPAVFDPEKHIQPSLIGELIRQEAHRLLIEPLKFVVIDSIAEMEPDEDNFGDCQNSIQKKRRIVAQLADIALDTNTLMILPMRFAAHAQIIDYAEMVTFSGLDQDSQTDPRISEARWYVEITKNRSGEFASRALIERDEYGSRPLTQMPSYVLARKQDH